MQGCVCNLIKLHDYGYIIQSDLKPSINRPAAVYISNNGQLKVTQFLSLTHVALLLASSSEEGGGLNGSIGSYICLVY
jgi:hypothetical protein